jgi:hypothetical protein
MLIPEDGCTALLYALKCLTQSRDKSIVLRRRLPLVKNKWNLSRTVMCVLIVV